MTIRHSFAVDADELLGIQSHAQRDGRHRYAMITLSDATRAVFFADFGVANWLLVVEATPDGALTTFRRRKINDGKIFDSTDEQEWRYGKTRTVDEAIEVAKKIFKEAGTVLGGKVWTLIRGSATYDEFVQEFLKLPFAHAKQIDNVSN